MIRYGEKLDYSEVLGPFKRAALWVYGCEFHCEGCVGQAYKEGKFYEASTHELSEWLTSLEVEGITISGGEPMLQAGALSKMLKEVKEKKDVGVIVYSGYTYEELLESDSVEIHNFLNYIDLLIDGKYVKQLDDNRSYVGSSNQRVICLSERYKDIVGEYYGSVGRKIEIKVKNKQFILVGVPSHDQLIMWKHLKQLKKTNY